MGRRATNTADVDGSIGPAPIALNNIGQEACEGHMAFFFLLHTPGPGDLDLRGKVGRTQTGSFWRLPIGRRAVRVRRWGGVVRERRLGRRIAALASATVLLISQLILAGFVLTATALNAAAQEPPKIEEAKGKPGELKLPDDLLVDTGKGGKKLRPPACDKCQDEWTALKAALTAYYAAQSLEGYQNSSKGQNFKDQEKAGNSGMKDFVCGFTRPFGWRPAL